jgi:glycerol dehydrogenase-like iron-containing ADH family enzyme
VLGKKPLVLWDATVKGIVGKTLLDSLTAEALEPVDVDFQGDCTRKEVDRVIGIIKDTGADIAASGYSV